MARALRTAVTGWLTGFAVAVAWSLTGAHNPAGARALAPWAIGGLVVLVAMLALAGVHDLVARWTAAREQRRDAAWFERVESPPRVAAPAPRVATAAEQAAAARVALLEARLAREQEELDEAMRLLAEQEVLDRTVVAERVTDPTVGRSAAEAEPQLREELVEALVELLGRRVTDGQSLAEVAGLLERTG